MSLGMSAAWFAKLAESGSFLLWTTTEDVATYSLGRTSVTSTTRIRIAANTRAANFQRARKTRNNC